MEGLQPVLPGFRLPDTKDSLDGRTPRRQKLGLNRDPRIDALMSLLALLQEETDEVSLSSLREIIDYSVFAFFSALFINITCPNSLLWRLCWFPVWSPMSLVHIWIGLTAAYTDRRDIATKNYTDSIISFIIYIVTLLAPYPTAILWHFSLHLIHFTWTNLGSATTSCAIICTFLHVVKIPPSWVSSTGEFVNLLLFHAITGGTNAVFITITTTMGLWRYMRSVTRIVANILCKTTVWVCARFRPQLWQLRGKFSYSSLPQVEKLGMEESIALNAGSGEIGEGVDVPKIRLLRLRRKWPLLELRADLIICDLENCPPYHAISYVWNHGPQDMRSIILNDMEFYVRGNVYNILRRCSSYLGPRLIWIDSICVNQGKDSKEKSFQVRKMKDIYKNAGQVLVCLGDPPGTLHAMTLIWELDFIMKRFGNTYLAGYIAEFHRRRQFDRLLCARINALLDLLQNPWFERVWVLQEMVVAERLNIFYGSYSMAWSTFQEYLRPIEVGQVSGVLSAFQASREPTKTLAPLLTLAKVRFLTGYRTAFGYFGPKPLSQVLRLFISWKSSREIDKIFAIIGLVDGDIDVDFLKGLVNYDRPRNEIILELANHAVETGNVLENMDLAGIGWEGRDLTLPTWVVNWCTMSREVPLLGTFVPDHGYKAAVGKPSRVVKGDKDWEIVVRGQVADRIKRLASDMKLPSEPYPLSSIAVLNKYLDEIYALARAFVSDPYAHMERNEGAQKQEDAPSRKQQLQEAIWRTMIGDKTYHERPAPQSYEKTIATQIRFLRSIERYVDAANPETFYLMNPSEELKKKLGTPEEQEEYQKSLEEIENTEFLFDNPGSKRRFCVTEKGYIGMVPHLSQVGDIVCVFFGAKVPFIVRNADLSNREGGEGGRGRYQLVGEAYVHGMMDGQVLEMGSNEIDFTLI